LEFLDLLCLLLLGFLFLVLDFLDLGFVLVGRVFHLLVLIFDFLFQSRVIRASKHGRRSTYLLDFFRDGELDRVRDKLGVFLDDLLDLFLLQVLELVLLEEQTNFSAATKGSVDIVGGDGERSAGRRLPNILLVIVMLRNHLDTLCDEIRRVKANTGLTNHRDVRTGARGLREALASHRVVNGGHRSAKFWITFLRARLGTLRKKMS